jgi:osmotically-inducible protein OsmY
MPNRKSFDNLDPSLSDEEFEETIQLTDNEDLELERDLSTEELYDTQHGDGHTLNPQQAWEQGLTYTPPDDPATLPSDSLEGAEVAAGFSTTMEDTEPTEEMLEQDLEATDLELQNAVYMAIRHNSETMHLTDITVRVRDGIAILMGTVPGEEDIPLLDAVLTDITGLEDVEYRLDEQY